MTIHDALVRAKVTGCETIGRESNSIQMCVTDTWTCRLRIDELMADDWRPVLPAPFDSLPHSRIDRLEASLLKLDQRINNLENDIAR